MVLEHETLAFGWVRLLIRDREVKPHRVVPPEHPEKYLHLRDRFAIPELDGQLAVLYRSSGWPGWAITSPTRPGTGRIFLATTRNRDVLHKGGTILALEDASAQRDRDRGFLDAAEVRTGRVRERDMIRIDLSLERQQS